MTTVSNLETHLVLNRYLHRLLGATNFAELKLLLRPVEEGPDAGGQSLFFGRLVTQPELQLRRDSWPRTTSA